MPGPVPSAPPIPAEGTAFYGWKIVAVCSLTLFVSVGFGFYSFGAFFLALTAELGGSRAEVGGAIAIFSFTTGIIAPFLGRAVTHHSIRKLMSAGVVVLAAGFVITSRVEALWQFYFALGSVLSVGAAMVGGLTASSLVANWFVRQRGMALGIATMGISASGVVMAPAATWLIGAFGWRTTFVLYGVLTLVVVLPVVRTWVVNRPEDLGLHPDGDAAAPTIASESPDLVYTWHAALRDRNFWIIALAVSMNMCANGAILTHIIPHATDLGFSATSAALVLSSGAGFGVLGKVLFGWISDQIDKRAAMSLSSGLGAISCVMLLFSESYPALLAAGAVFGLGMGGLVPLWGTLIGAGFGRRAFGRVMGLMSPFMLPLQTVGVPLAGLIYDRTGSYALSFEIFAGLYAGAIVVLSQLRLSAETPRAAAAADPLA